MSTYFIGFVAGVCISSVILLVTISIKLLTYSSEVYAMNKTILTYIDRIDKVTQNTLSAADNFVDALRATEQMNHNGLFPMFGNPMDTNDIKKSFEDTIKNFEDDDDDEDGWKKK